MKEIVFDLKNVQCSYDRKKPVLKIKELQIPRGQMTILLGVSGAGKSTLLETLGLMNNTIMEGSEIVFHSPKKEYNLSDLWNKGEKSLSDVRNFHYSFIFQNTNLMPNFTAYENVAVTQLIQGVPLKEAITKVKKYMAVMGLSEVSQVKKTYELAGGQKQRLAFVRAITPEFDVLFADEPTGNLDRKNAREVMQRLKTEVTDKNKSAVIVTHDIILAEEFADKIIVINKKDGLGEINNTDIFTRGSGKRNWIDNTGQSADIMQLYSDILNQA